MKKSILGISFLLLSLLPMQLKAETILNPTTTSSKAPISAEMKIMTERLEEIKKMEFSTMSSAEKKELRNEVKTIKSNMRASGGVYISVGAIILILILLILLL